MKICPDDVNLCCEVITLDINSVSDGVKCVSEPFSRDRATTNRATGLSRNDMVSALGLCDYLSRKCLAIVMQGVIETLVFIMQV